MKRWLAIVVLLGLASCSPTVPVEEQQTKLPNIVFIMADDMGIGDVGCYNAASKIKTPNIDKIAAQGMRFTDMHSPSAVCTPTRYGVVTGRYCWRTSHKKSVLFGYAPLLIEAGRTTIAAFLKQLGYFTGVIGKWHLGLGTEAVTDYAKPLRPGPNAVGFDYFFGIPAGLDMAPYIYIENERPVAPATAFTPGGESQRAGGHGYFRQGPIAPGFKHEEVQPKLAEKAVAFIKKQEKSKPFFLYFPLSGPHEPWVPTKEFRGKSGAGPYGDFVQEMDASVGAVMKALDDAGLADNTLLIFCSDNGAHWLPEEIAFFKHKANGDWRGQKADIWEGGHRVPFVARWPGQIKPGTTTDEILCLTDLFATAAAMTGTKLPQDAAEDSFNFLPVLRGEKLSAPIRDYLVYHSFDGSFGVRQGPWMMTPLLGSRGFSPPQDQKPVKGGATGQLYNLTDDPAQTKNLWLTRPEQVKKLNDLIEKAQADGRTRPAN